MGRIDDLTQFAGDLARFLFALQQIDATRGPQPGSHNFHRGRSLANCDAEMRQAIVQNTRNPIHEEIACQRHPIN
ncbi:MAG: hypothetical protein AAF961_06540 [Planctomycetota bacterium]